MTHHSYPNKKNFCGGNFQDWLEVNLTEKCNGRCSWCVEKNGYHPKERAGWQTISEQALRSNRKNIILLGGEPTLYPDLSKIVQALSSAGRRVWVTTNGGRLNRQYILTNLNGITGINISIHDSSLLQNKSITGIYIKNLFNTVFALHDIKANVRFNCNCIKGHVDSIEAIERYIEFAKTAGADKIRFAELKHDDRGFVDLAKILNYKYSLNDNPFVKGCNSDAVINGMPVNFRQMCGLQTSRRVCPENPVQYAKSVLYYDGKFYNGWQTIKQNDGKLLELLNEVRDAVNKIRKDLHHESLCNIEK
jgi:sulfatase maturation enzyme AslB (radical SAM superfamily)